MEEFDFNKKPITYKLSKGNNNIVYEGNSIDKCSDIMSFYEDRSDFIITATDSDGNSKNI